MSTMNTRIKVKNDLATNWSNTSVAGQGGNLVLLQGEIAVEWQVSGGIIDTTKPPKFKIGNGTQAYKDLKYVSSDYVFSAAANGVNAEIILKDGNNVSQKVVLKPGNNITLTTDASSNITVAAADTTYTLAAVQNTNGAKLVFTPSSGAVTNIPLTNLSASAANFVIDYDSTNGITFTLGVFTGTGSDNTGKNGLIPAFNTANISSSAVGQDDYVLVAGDKKYHKLPSGVFQQITYDLTAEAPSGSDTGANIRLTGSDSSTDNVNISNSSNDVNLTVSRTDATHINITADTFTTTKKGLVPAFSASNKDATKISATDYVLVGDDGKYHQLPATAFTDNNTTYDMFVGQSTSTGNAAATNGNVYIHLKGSDSTDDKNLISGSGLTTVTSNASGAITVASNLPAVTNDAGKAFTGTNNNTFTQTNVTDLELDGYTLTAGQGAIVDGDTLENAFSKLQNSIANITGCLIMKGSVSYTGGHWVITSSDATINGKYFEAGSSSAYLTTYKAGWIFKAASAGTWGTETIEIGDSFTAIKDPVGATFVYTDWLVGQANIDVFIGATATKDGTTGQVPQPVAGDQGKFLRGDATWQTIPAANNGKLSVTVGNASPIEFTANQAGNTTATIDNLILDCGSSTANIF